MDIKSLSFALIAVAALTIASGAQAQHPAMPAGMTHEEHLAQMQKDAEMKARGAEAMGFDQNTTTHHFRLTNTGGAIEVSANSPSDTAARDAIRAHLKEIAGEFARGNFEKPFMTHGEVPPGVTVMKQSAGKIRYAFGKTAGGGEVRIETDDVAARDAVYAFLRYQITEHKTGDPLTIR